MANVADTKHTGPAAKNQVSGGKKFPIKEKNVPSGNPKLSGMNNKSDGAKRSIMSLKFNNGGKFPKATKESFTRNKAPRGKA